MRLTWALTSVITAVTLAAGAVASNAAPLPKWYINGTKAGASHIPIVFYGEIKFEAKTVGNLQCEMLGSGSVWNEISGGTEKGMESTEAFTSYNCVSEAKCKAENSKGEKVEGISFSAEEPPKDLEVGKEKVAKRVGESTLPWSGEVVESEGVPKLRFANMEVEEVIPPSGGAECPSEGLEIPWRGGVEPIIENGKKNGLYPGNLKFEGKGGKTGFWTSPVLPTFEEQNIFYLISEPNWTLVGRRQQLVNVEG